LLKKSLIDKLEYFKKVDKVNRGVNFDGDVSNITQIYAIYLIVDPEFASEGLERLLPLCKGLKGKERPEIARTLLDFVITSLQEENVIYNHEAMFNHFLIDESIQENSIQTLIKTVDVEQLESDAEETDSDDDSEDEGFDEDEDEGKAKARPAKIPKFRGLSTINVETNDSEAESLDMDQMEDDQLEAMDKVLANVFTQKKKAKEEKQMETKFLMRILHLMELTVRRYKVPSAGMPLMLLTYYLSLLGPSKNPKAVANRFRGVSLIKQLNLIKKIKETEDVDSALVSQIIGDIGTILSRKCPKEIRALLKGTVCMLFRVYLKEKYDGLDDDVKVIIESCLQSQGGPSTKANNRKRRHH